MFFPLFSKKNDKTIQQKRRFKASVVLVKRQDVFVIASVELLYHGHINTGRINRPTTTINHITHTIKIKFKNFSNFIFFYYTLNLL